MYFFKQVWQTISNIGCMNVCVRTFYGFVIILFINLACEGQLTDIVVVKFWTLTRPRALKLQTWLRYSVCSDLVCYTFS